MRCARSGRAASTWRATVPSYPLREIARRLGKSVQELPAGLLRTALAVGSALSVSRGGTEQLDFLRYRPVLLNTALKEVLVLCRAKPAPTRSRPLSLRGRSRAARWLRALRWLPSGGCILW